MVDELPTLADVVQKLENRYGEYVCQLNPITQNIPKIPTGILACDIALLGGLIKGKINTIYGPPRSGKGNLIKKIIAYNQQYTQGIIVYIDTEHDYNAQWASLLGVDNSRVLLQTPLCAEETIDIAIQSLYTSDIDFLIIDSLAEMVSSYEVNEPSEKSKVGGTSHLISSLGRQLVRALSYLERTHGKQPTVILVNQPRTNIGTFYKSETLPGGRLIVHASPLIIRVSGKTEYSKVNGIDHPLYHETKITVKDAKMPIFSKEAIFKMGLVNDTHNKYKVGHIDNLSILKSFLKKLNLMHKSENGCWIFLDNEYKTQKDILQSLGDYNSICDLLCKELYNELYGK